MAPILPRNGASGNPGAVQCLEPVQRWEIVVDGVAFRLPPARANLEDWFGVLIAAAIRLGPVVAFAEFQALVAEAELEPATRLGAVEFEPILEK
jgi:hypothetical protein